MNDDLFKHRASPVLEVAMQAHADALPLALERAGGSRRQQPVAPQVQDRRDICEVDRRAIGPDARPPYDPRGLLVVASAWLAFYLIAAIAMTIGATAQAQAGQFARECALKETMVITLIEDHGAAEDLPADRLGDAGLTMLRARLACYEGRVGEALALYESIFDLGPVASLRRQRP
jgi:hypothetical protein